MTHFTTGNGRPCKAPAISSSSKSIGAIACEASKRERIDADHDRGVERLTALLGHVEEHVGVARQQQHAEPVRPGELAAVDRDVLLSGLRIAHDHQAGADVRPAVVLVVGRQRQLAHQIDLAMHHLLRRRGRHLLPRRSD